MSIPIQNIYYLLCYAWDRLDEKDAVYVSKEEFSSVQDLLAKVLVNGVSRILKRGLERTYVDTTNDLSAIKGKLDFSSSIKRNLFPRQRALCSFDEFSSDNLNNQILLSAIRTLLGTTGVSPSFKLQLRNLMPNFSHVKVLKLNSGIFKQVKIHRNNKHYEFPLKVCQLIAENSIPAERPGTYKFLDFERDENKMNRLFEQFVLNFYNREQADFKVSAEHITWKLFSEREEDMSYIPKMRTDITLKNSERKIIIDAKYYKETLKKYYEKESLNSANLYQMASYLINQQSSEPVTQSVMGILLYPETHTSLDLQYKFCGHSLAVKTVNLAMDWNLIDKSLKELIKKIS